MRKVSSHNGQVRRHVCYRCVAKVGWAETCAILERVPFYREQTNFFKGQLGLVKAL
ncbi:MAG: hypothetical protein V1676_00155 [Candidatus Diapherotrites archaeon]